MRPRGSRPALRGRRRDVGAMLKLTKSEAENICRIISSLEPDFVMLTGCDRWDDPPKYLEPLVGPTKST